MGSRFPLDPPARMLLMDRLPTIAARGVYYLPWLGTEDEVYLAAVTRFGRQIDLRLVSRGEDAKLVELELWDILDRDDPEPILRLVS